MAEKVNISGDASFHMSQDQFNLLVNSRNGGNGGNGGGGNDVHITVEVKGQDNGKGAYEVHRSWFGDYDESTKTYEFSDMIQNIVNALGKLESSLSKAGKTLDDFYEASDARNRLYDKKTQDGLGWTTPDELERYAEIAKAPEKYLNDIMSEVDSIFSKFSKTNWQKYTQEKAIKDVTNKYGSIGNRKNDIINALGSGNLRDAITMIDGLRGSKNALQRMVDKALPEITRLDNENANKQAAEQARKEAESARKEADEANRRAAEQQRVANEKLKAANDEINNLKQQIANNNRGNNDGGGGNNRNGMGGGNGGFARPGGGNGGMPPSGHDSFGVNPPDGRVIRFFESLQELTNYLNNLHGSDLQGTGEEIRGIIESLGEAGAVARNINAEFERINVGDEDNPEMRDVLRGVSVSAFDKRFTKAELARIRFGVGYRQSEEDRNDYSYSITGRNVQTLSNTQMIERYEDQLQSELRRLLDEFTSLVNHPVMFGDSATNPLRKQLYDAIGLDNNGDVRLRRLDTNGQPLPELNLNPNTEDLDRADETLKSIRDQIKAINNIIPKTLAGSAIEQMSRRADKMNQDIANMPAKFNDIKHFNQDGMFKAYEDAAEAYNNASNPTDRAQAYTTMFKEHEKLTRMLRTETEEYHRNTRAQKEAEGVNKAGKTIDKYEKKYLAMGNGKPQQISQARQAIKRYRNAATAEEKNKAYDDIQENMSWMRDDLDARYQPEMQRQRKNEKDQRQKTTNARKVFRSNLKKTDVEGIRSELAKMAEPYGGLDSDTLPKYIADVLKQIDSFYGEKDLPTRDLKFASLQKKMKEARREDKNYSSLTEANELITRMMASPANPMTANQINNLQAAIDQVNGLNDSSTISEKADAFANLAARAREAAEAQKEFEKADAQTAKSQDAANKVNNARWVSYEGYTKQIESIRLAYEKMGKTVDTSGVDSLMTQLFGADATNPKAINDIKSQISIEMNRLKEQMNLDKAVFGAENKRDAKTTDLNNWISGLNIDEQNLQKIQELQAALQALNAIDLNAPGQLTDFNNQFKNIDKISDDAKKQVEALERYRAAVSNQNYGLLGNEHGDAATRQMSADIKTQLEDAHNIFMTDQSEANLQALLSALDAMEARLKDIKQIDAFGKLNEDVAKLTERMDYIKTQHGDQAKWSPAQQGVVTSFNNLYQNYQAQVQAGNYDGAKEAAHQLKNQVTALNESFSTGSGLVGVFDGKLGKLATRLLGIGSGFMAINKVITTFKKMVDNVTKIDTAMTELKKVTDETQASYARFQKESGKTAVQIGSSVTDLINTSVEYGRMGYSLAESQQLGITTTKFANTGNFGNVTEASDALIAIIRGFDELNISDAEKVSDKLTAVANAYAVTASDIAAGLQRSASALNLGGVNVDQATAMITAISEVTRDSSAAGNAIKTLSMRIRGAKTE